VRPPSTKDYVLCLLALLMTGHLTFLGFAAHSCDERAQSLPPDKQPGEVCQRLPGEFQKAVETYIAVILALLAPISKAD